MESASDFPSGQSDWRYCGKCAGIFFAGNVVGGQPFLGHCPEGGTHAASGGDYAIGSSQGPTATGTPQDNWRYCPNCALMFYAGNSNGICSAPGHLVHDYIGASGDYTLVYGPTSNVGSAEFIVTWQSFDGQLQDDCDQIEVTFQDNPGSPGEGVYTLEAGRVSPSGKG